MKWALGRQLHSVQMKIKPGYYVYANPQPEEDFQSLAINLKIKTQDPKTQVKVTYPKSIKKESVGFSVTYYEGDLAIQAIVQRADGDNSLIEGVLSLRAMAFSH